jgi:hypothetical protein
LPFTRKGSKIANSPAGGPGLVEQGARSGPEAGFDATTLKILELLRN